MKRFWLLLALIALIACTGRPAAEQIAQATGPRIALLDNGAEYNLTAAPAIKEIAGAPVRMLAYNNQISGPVLQVKQNSTVTIHFKNEMKYPTAIHWHGVRVLNRYDGAAGLTQEEVAPGNSFDYVLTFPDDGIYWYHPHVREDLQQESGLYGAIVVDPIVPYEQVDREEVLFVDDISLYLDQVEPFNPDKTNYALMGRFGHQMLINGGDNYSLDVDAGEVVRFSIIDSANTRMFNFSIENTTLKVIGGDSGLYEKEFLSNSTVLAPGERAMVEATFERPGTYAIRNVNPYSSYTLGTVHVVGEAKRRPDFANLHNHTVVAQRFKKYFNSTPDLELSLTMSMNMNHGMGMIHTEPIEWEDTMAQMNAMSTDRSIEWHITDVKTGRKNMDINYTVHVGDAKKIRIHNDPHSMHPMQHPMHLHGQRFLILDENGKKNNNLAWKDVVLVPTGEYVDILVDFSNPGDWMMHCHIAEHLQSGMMSIIKVLP